MITRGLIEYVKATEDYKSYVENMKVALDKNKSRKIRRGAEGAAYRARAELIYNVADKFLIDEIKVGFIINEVLDLINKENKILIIAPLHIEEINENLI